MKRKKRDRRNGKNLKKEGLLRRTSRRSFLERNIGTFDGYVPGRNWFYIVMGIICWTRLWDFIDRVAQVDGVIGDRYVVLTWSLIYVTVWVAVHV
jgi:hypothetical protein